MVNTNSLEVFTQVSFLSRTDLKELIQHYQRNISPKLREQFGDFCKFNPSCSYYALEAIDRYGQIRGGILTLGRLLRCNPYSIGGYDPVL